MEKFLNKIFTAKMEDKIKEIPENTVDLIATDPPYG